VTILDEISMHVPKPVRWLLVIVALSAGWAAGSLLQSQTAARDAAGRVRPATAPTTLPHEP
jgi:hypothetical protein